MKESMKHRMVSFGYLLAAAILGAAIWEGAGHAFRPAMAQQQNYPDPRNVTAMRMEQLKATAQTNQHLQEIFQLLQSGDLKIQADVLSMPEESTSIEPEKTRKKKSSRKSSAPKPEIEIIRD